MEADVRAVDRVSTTDQPGFKIGKALLEGARSAALTFTGNFDEDRKFAIGENQWPSPNSFRAWYRQRWKNESVRNYTFNIINKKMSVVLATKGTVVAEPRDELTTLPQRLDIAEAVKHEAARIKWPQYRRGAFFNGAVCGKGVVHFYPERRHYQLPTGEVIDLFEVRAELVNMKRYYPQPGPQYLSEADYVWYEPDVSMARARRIFPDTWQLIKPQERSLGNIGQVNYSRTQDEIIYGNGTGEISIDKDGNIVDRFAPIAFGYIKGQEVISDVKSVLDREAMPGLKCTDCGMGMEKDQAVTDYSNPSKPLCPTCYGSNLTQAMLPPQYEREMQRMLDYPHGRLICMTKDALLYDGPLDIILDEVFPFAEYNHYPITDRYWPYGDVALLKKVQQALNSNIAQGINNMRLCGNPPMEVPAEVPAYRHVGNAPGDQVVCPAAFMNLAHYVSPAQSYNVQLHQILEDALKRDIQEVSGVTDVSSGIAPTAPTSGKEVIARQEAASTRMDLHNTLFNEFESDAYSILWQMMNQLYTEPRAYQSVKVNGELEAIVLEVSTLPRNVKIKVTSSLDQQAKDVNFGQNLMQAVTAGQVGFYPDLMLPLMGATPEVSREIQRRETLRLQQIAQQQQAQMMAAAAPGGGAEALPPGTSPTPPAAALPAPAPGMPQVA